MLLSNLNVHAVISNPYVIIVSFIINGVNITLGYTVIYVIQ